MVMRADLNTSSSFGYLLCHSIFEPEVEVGIYYILGVDLLISQRV
jgi:hypothetical protein